MQKDIDTILGVDNKPITTIKFDVFNADKPSLAGLKYSKDGRSFSPPDFKDNEEYKSFSEQMESTKKDK